MKHSRWPAVLIAVLAAGFWLLPCLESPVAAAETSPRAPAAVEYIPQFANVNHPQICYCFFPPALLENDKYLAMVDSLADQGLYTMVFLTARNGMDFHETEKLRPVFKKLVERAHQRGLKVGLQLWPPQKKPIALENTERLIVEGEATLDEQGAASYTGTTRNVRSMTPLLQSDLLRAYAFQRTAEGFYDPATLQEITANCVVRSPDKSTVQVEVKAGPALRGRTVYLMTQHYYNGGSNHDPATAAQMVATLLAYRDIPFDGIALDEFTNLRISPPWDMKKTGGVFRERLYSLAMAKEFQDATGQPLERALFDMRYAPAGQPEVRMRAINVYMDTMRHGTLHIENAVYKAAKELFGPATFAGVHNTHHNQLQLDEFWVTGDQWWSLPREYGHTDEHTPLPTQMGIAMSCSQNAMFNMYYHKSLDAIVAKALGDLRYGIRTHYHALNDVQAWGASLEKPESFAAINPVERGTRLLNRFNPSLPEIKLLVVFGMEALANWYPDPASRGIYDINDKLAVEEKAQALWQAGYLNALVPSDLIESGRLRLNAKGKPELNGHVFDAIVYLNPQYARESVLVFLERYVAAGGKLMLEGQATHDFQAREISRRFAGISGKAIVKKFDVKEVVQLGIAKTLLHNGARNEDGSYIFTNLPSLTKGPPANFEVSFGKDTYSGDYHGLAAIAADIDGELTKFAAAGFLALRRNGQAIFSLKQPADVFITKEAGGYKIVVAGDKEKTSPEVNVLFNQGIGH